MNVMQHAMELGRSGPYDYIDAIAFRENGLREVVLMAARRHCVSDRELSERPKKAAPRDWWERRVRSRLVAHVALRKGGRFCADAHDQSRPMSKIQSATRSFDAFCSEDLSLWQYLFRYDRGAFWMGLYSLPCLCELPLPGCLKSLGAAVCIDNPSSPAMRTALRLLGGLDTTRNLYRSLHLVKKEFIRRQFSIHDFHLPVHRVLSFIGWVDTNMEITPIWLCPVMRAQDDQQKLSCHFLPESHYPRCRNDVCQFCNATATAMPRVGLVNVGVYGHNPFASRSLELNTKMEDKVTALGGRKLLYSQLYQGRARFWSVYDKKWYDCLRDRYVGREGVAPSFPDIHEKLVYQAT